MKLYIYLIIMLTITNYNYSAEDNQQIAIEQPEMINQMSKDILDNISEDDKKIIMTKIKSLVIENLNLLYDKNMNLKTLTADEITQMMKNSLNKLADEHINSIVHNAITAFADEQILEFRDRVKYCCINFKKNLSWKTFTKTIIYRIIASLDSILMTYIFITHNISFIQALQLGAVDIVGKFFLYYIYERMWAMECCKRINICKKNNQNNQEFTQAPITQDPIIDESKELEAEQIA